MQLEIISERFYGEPQLEKPKALKGIREDFSEDFIPGHYRFKVWIDGDDLWIQCRDWFSSSFQSTDPEDFGAPQCVLMKKYFPEHRARKERFNYADNWASIILRNEAWLLYKGVLEDMRRWREYRERNGFGALRTPREERIESDWNKRVDIGYFGVGSRLPMEIGVRDEMCRQLERVQRERGWKGFEEGSLSVGYWSRFFERVVKRLSDDGYVKTQ